MHMYVHSMCSKNTKAKRNFLLLLCFFQFGNQERELLRPPVIHRRGVQCEISFFDSERSFRKKRQLLYGFITSSPTSSRHCNGMPRYPCAPRMMQRGRSARLGAMKARRRTALDFGSSQNGQKGSLFSPAPARTLRSTRWST